MDIWGAISDAWNSAADATTAKWRELQTAMSTLRERAAVLTGLMDEVNSMNLPESRKAEAGELFKTYSVVKGSIDAAMNVFKKAYDAVVSDDQLQGLGIGPIAIGFIVAAIPVVYFAIDSVNTTIARTQAFIAGERAARTVLENGGSAAEANQARESALKSYGGLASSTSGGIGSGIQGALKAALPIALILGAVWLVPKMLPAKRENPRIAFERRKLARKR